MRRLQRRVDDCEARDVDEVSRFDPSGSEPTGSTSCLMVCEVMFG